MTSNVAALFIHQEKAPFYWYISSIQFDKWLSTIRELEHFWNGYTEQICWGWFSLQTMVLHHALNWRPYSVCGKKTDNNECVSHRLNHKPHHTDQNPQIIIDWNKYALQECSKHLQLLFLIFELTELRLMPNKHCFLLHLFRAYCVNHLSSDKTIWNSIEHN